MRIVLDMQSRQSPSRVRGIGRYSLALARQMAKLATGHEVIVAVNGALAETVDAVRADFDGLIPADLVGLDRFEARKRIVAELQRLDLLEKVDSKYGLVVEAAKRARQINSFYQNSEDGVFEFVGPLVSPEPGEKPLSIALREIEAGLLEHEEGQ